MRLLNFVSGALMLLSASAVATETYTNSKSSFCVIRPATPLQQKARFDDFVKKLFVQRMGGEAYHKYAVKDVIQHNPFTLSSAQASIDTLNKIIPGSTLVVYHHTFDLLTSTGWVHTRASGGSSFGEKTAIADIYKFEGSCIVEHWDVIQGLPPNATNPLALF